MAAACAPARRHRADDARHAAGRAPRRRAPPGRWPTCSPACSRRQGAPPRGIAYKTGTSYGYRDAWSVGFDGRHVLGVWVGRADGGAVPGLAGYVSAAPILFEAFARSGLAAVTAAAPAGRRAAAARDDLPVTLGAFAPGADGLAVPADGTARSRRRRSSFRRDGARVDLAGSGRRAAGAEAAGRPARRSAGSPMAGRWPPLHAAASPTGSPDGPGSSTLTVIDAAGRAASVTVTIE